MHDFEETDPRIPKTNAFDHLVIQMHDEARKQLEMMHVFKDYCATPLNMIHQQFFIQVPRHSKNTSKFFEKRMIPFQQNHFEILIAFEILIFELADMIDKTKEQPTTCSKYLKYRKIFCPLN